MQELVYRCDQCQMAIKKGDEWHFAIRGDKQKEEKADICPGCVSKITVAQLMAVAK